MQYNERIDFPADGECRWAGMANYLLVPPDRRHQVTLNYAGEAPHGDSFHTVEVDGARLPGLAWGCDFAFTPDSRYLAASWMPALYDRRTIVVDIEKRLYLVLPLYIRKFRFVWPVLQGVGGASPLSFRFDGTQVWSAF